MDINELFQRIGLAIVIGAAVGVERHWREREARQGARTAGIRTFTMIGMLGGVAGLLEYYLARPGGYPGIVLGVFLLALAGVMAVFELREAIAEENFSVTSVVAAMLTFGLGALAILGDTALASAGGAALVAILASREYLHAAIRKLQWVELRSAVILLAMTFVLLPIIPDDPVGPFGGVSPKSILVLAILLASISFAGYVAVRMFGASRGAMLGGAIGGIISSTATTIAFARRSEQGEEPRLLAAGAVSAGAVSLLRTGLLVVSLAAVLAPLLLPALFCGAAAMMGYGLMLANRKAAQVAQQSPSNPFELSAVVKMALMLVAVAFAAQAATQFFGSAGLMVASALSGLADVDAVTVTVAGMRAALPVETAAAAIATAVLANMIAKGAYASMFGTRPYALHLWLASIAGAVAALAGYGVGRLL